MKINLEQAKNISTPFYWYDLNLLKATLKVINKCIYGKPIKVYYAVKANLNPLIISEITKAGLGADCVSGGEINECINQGFTPNSITYAGVGKTDDEILLGMKAGIGIFNVESIEELQIIEELASNNGYCPNICLRVNPNIDAHTHHYITTGIEENKFGIDLPLLDKAINIALNCKHLKLVGLHFHIGSQITILEPFKLLCERINNIIDSYRAKGVEFKIINVGGGLGIDYDEPDKNPIPDFKGFFHTLLSNLHLSANQEIHCELGRSIVAQCGTLVSRVTYVKKGLSRKFIILDAGMNDLIRPALYGAFHKIENLSATDLDTIETYDVVGPICESSDTFGKEIKLPITKRGDIILLRSAGAYGETMASTYNCRPLPHSIVK